MAKKMSILSRSLRPQLGIAFCLMSVIPILTLCNLIFPSFFLRAHLGAVVAVVVLLSVSGLFIVKRIIDSIILLNSEVKSIAGGELSQTVNASRDDEIGELGAALNHLTHHIKDNMDELKIYGERTKDINSKINKQVVALSGVLQIGNLISSKTNLQDVFDIAVSRLAQVTNSSSGFVILERAAGFEVAAQYGLKADAVEAVEFAAQAPVLKSLLSVRGGLRIMSRDQEAHQGALLKILGAKNALITPLLILGRAEGFLGIAHSADLEYSEEDVELLNVFSRQMVIAIENDRLSKKVEDLEIIDALTGLYNRRYIIDRLDEEIMRAIFHQRPCAFIVLKMRGLASLADNSGEEAVEETLRKVAELLKMNLGEFDRAARMGSDEFALVLPEKNKRRAEDVARELKNKVNFALGVDKASKDSGTAVAVVENPIDGTDAATLLEKAQKLLREGSEV
jgi:diguanylate cyclase (GGDEF)-like protein